jgi:hypothetical protein
MAPTSQIFLKSLEIINFIGKLTIVLGFVFILFGSKKYTTLLSKTIPTLACFYLPKLISFLNFLNTLRNIYIGMEGLYLLE